MSRSAVRNFINSLKLIKPVYLLKLNGREIGQLDRKSMLLANNFITSEYYNKMLIHGVPSKSYLQVISHTKNRTSIIILKNTS